MATSIGGAVTCGDIRRLKLLAGIMSRGAMRVFVGPDGAQAGTDALGQLEEGVC